MSNDTWQDMLPGSFGMADKRFGGHATDRAAAREMLAAAFKANAHWKEVEAEARRFLSQCKPEHVEEQIKLMRDVKSYLSD